MRGPSGGTVSFHGIDGIDDRQLRIHCLSQFNKHPGKIFDLRPTIVHLRLLKSRNGAEQILDASGVTGHGMGFQLTDIDNIIRLTDRRDQMEGMIGKTGRTIHSFRGKIHIQLNIRLQLLHAADRIDIFHILCVIESAGALCQRNVLHSLFSQPPGDRLDHQRMRRGGKLRAFCHDKVWFDHNLKFRPQLLRDLKILHESAYCRIYLFLLIFLYQINRLFQINLLLPKKHFNLIPDLQYAPRINTPLCPQ